MQAEKVIIFEGSPACCGSFSEWCRRTRWIITTTYIEKQSGLCCESIDNLQLIRVKDLQYKSSCCCSCCGVITILSSDQTTPTLIIAGIPGSKDVFERIRNAISQAQTGARLEIAQ